jgi:hypothetical protein
MHKPLIAMLAAALLAVSSLQTALADTHDIEAELDAFWAAMSTYAREGDFEGMKSAYHSDAVIVNGIRVSSKPIAHAFARWEQGVNDTRDGKMEANVEFRFSQRLHDDTTAHETGIFYYTAKPIDGERTHDYIFFEALMVKQDGEWKMVMEYQKARATEADWDTLGEQTGYR